MLPIMKTASLFTLICSLVIITSVALVCTKKLYYVYRMVNIFNKCYNMSHFFSNVYSLTARSILRGFILF